MALIGEVAETLLLRPTASVLSTTQSTAQIVNEAEVETDPFPSVYKVLLSDLSTPYSS